MTTQKRALADILADLKLADRYADRLPEAAVNAIVKEAGEALAALPSADTDRRRFDVARIRAADPVPVTPAAAREERDRRAELARAELAGFTLGAKTALKAQGTQQDPQEGAQELNADIEERAFALPDELPTGHDFAADHAQHPHLHAAHRVGHIGAALVRHAAHLIGGGMPTRARQIVAHVLHGAAQHLIRD